MATPRPARKSWNEYILFAEAVVALAAASLLIRFAPFRVVVKTMGARDPNRRPGGSPLDLIAAVKRASRRTQWRTVCFQQGLAAHWMLRRRGFASRLHYGVRSDGEAMQAHVWVAVAGDILIGDDADPHVQVATFPPEAGGPRRRPDGTPQARRP